MADTCHVTAPANLLLMGEYAVLEEGGLGIGVAPDVRATGTSVPGADEVVGHLPAGVARQSVRWPGDEGLLGRVADYLATEVGGGPGSVTLDTSAFFDRDGRKRGLGSSAAVAVVLTALWMLRSGKLEEGPGSVDAVFRHAVEAHRAGQGGAGSGYDVACSCYGGAVLFTGGDEPQAVPIELPWLPTLAVFPGRQAVRTVGAVERLAQWRNAHPDAWQAFLRTSNELVAAFAKAGSWTAAAGILEEYRSLTVSLGADIGVPAQIAPPPEVPRRTFSKAVGAGNELGVAFVRPPQEQSMDFVDGPDSPLRQLGIAETGVSWSGGEK